MYAIVEIGGKQMKVEEQNFIYVNRLAEEEGANIELDKVLLLDNEGSINIGAPHVSGAKVSATVLEHLKDDKVIVFKKKRRKGYKKKNGHRQHLTKVMIDKISA